MFEQIVMTSQSPRSLNRDSFRTPPWESWDKKPFGCGCRGEVQRILYGGRWWLLRIRVVVNLVSLELPMACPSTKGDPKSELTNMLVV
jgi:hypothetical protein